MGLARLDEVERDGGRVLVEQLLEEAREREQRAGRRGEEYEGAKDALKWAGMTYFVAALASVAQFLYLLLLLMRRR